MSDAQLLSDDDVFGAAKQPDAQSTGLLSDDDVFGAPPPSTANDVGKSLISGGIKGGANLAAATVANINPVTGAAYDAYLGAKYGLPFAKRLADDLARETTNAGRAVMGKPAVPQEEWDKQNSDFDQQHPILSLADPAKLAEMLPSAGDAISKMADIAGVPLYKPQTEAGSAAENIAEFGGIGGVKKLPATLAGAATMVGAQAAAKAVGTDQTVQDLAALLGGAGGGAAGHKFAGSDFGTLGSVAAKETDAVTPNVVSPQSSKVGSEDLRARAKPYYDYAKSQNVDFTSDVQAGIPDDITAAMAKTGKMNARLHGDSLSVLDDMKQDAAKGNLDMETLHQYRQLFGDVIDNNLHPNGKMKPDALKASQAIDTIDDTLNAAKNNPDMLASGNPEAIKAWQDGQSIWAAAARANDIERIMQRSELMQNPATSMRQGFATLAGNPKRFNRFTPEQQELIKDGSQAGLGGEALRAIGSRLVSIAAFSGHPIAGLASIPVSAAARSLSAQYQAARGQKIIDNITGGAKGDFVAPAAKAKPLAIPPPAINVPEGGFGTPPQPPQTPDTEYNQGQRALPSPREMSYEDMVRAGRILPNQPRPDSVGAANGAVDTVPAIQHGQYRFGENTGLTPDVINAQKGLTAIANGQEMSPAAQEVNAAALHADTEPSEAQKSAGNYQKGHTNIQGLDVSIENPAASVRRGVGADGEPWETTMPAHYGYIKKTMGADGDHVDAFIGDNPESRRVFVVDQIDPQTGAFDEHKAMVGFDSAYEARKTYQKSFSDDSGKERMGAFTPMSMDEFKAWLKSGDTTKPLNYEKPDKEEWASQMADEVSRQTAPIAEQVREGDQEQVIRQRAKAMREKPLNALEYLASKGGLKDTNGDLKAMDMHKTFVPGFGKLVREKGKLTPDDAALYLHDAGYFGNPNETERPTVDDLHDVLQEGIAKNHIYPSGDRSALEAYYERRQQRAQKKALESDADRYGVETKGKTHDQIVEELKHAKATEDAAHEFAQHDDDERAAMEAYYGGDKDLIPQVKDHEEIPFDDAPPKADQAFQTQERHTGAGKPSRESGEISQRGEERVGQSREEGGQQVIPGAERISDKELAERKMAEASKAKAPQKAADEGLFDVAGRGQKDLMDLANKPEPFSNTKFAAEVKEAIEGKNADKLRDILGNLDNEKSRALFEKETGVKLPKTVGGTGKAIDAWAGVSEKERQSRNAERDDKQKAKTDARNEEHYGKQLEKAQETGSGKNLREATDDLIDRGFNKVVKNGNSYFLANEKGEGTNISRMKGFAEAIREYVQAKTARLEREAKAKLPEQKAKTIEDAGEKIGGARKDTWAQRGLTLDDLKDMSGGEEAKFVTKDHVWPKPDYAELVANGMEPHAAALLKILRDRLGAKPRSDTPEGRRDFVDVMSKIREIGEKAKSVSDIKNLRDQIVHDHIGWPKEWQASRNAPPEMRRRLFSVMKGSKEELGVTYNDLHAKADKMLREGFPGEREPWQRTMRVSPSVYTGKEGKWVVSDKKTFRGLAEADSKEEAIAKAKELHEKAQADRKANGNEKQTPARPHLDKLQRTGKDIRGGKDVDSKDFVKDFGFRGVEFGNWVASDERQKSVNLAYDAMHDLAHTLNVPPEALSLNGKMGLAFGARGGEPFAAHYEPSKLVINLTKLQGAGSLAHEFGHALDHYFGELDRQDAYQGAPKGGSGWYERQNYADTSMPQENGMRKQPERAVGSRLANLRPEIRDAFNNIMSKIFSRNMEKAEYIRDLEQLQEKMQGNIETQQKRIDDHLKRNPDVKTQDKQFLSGSKSYIEQTQRRLAQNAENLEKARAEDAPQPDRKVDTSYFKNAKSLSGKSGENGYWARPTEMFARAFESYVFDKMKENGIKSDYLVHGVEPERYTSGSYEGNPYPTDKERAAIDGAFDKFFQTVKTREGDNGRQTMYQKSDKIAPGQYESVAPGLEGERMDKFSKNEQALTKAVNDVVARMAPGAETKFYRSMRTPEGENVTGAYFRTKSTTRRFIAMALGGPDAVTAAKHEVIHDLKRNGFFSQDEWSALQDAALQKDWLNKHNIDDRYKELDPHQRLEEAIAEEFSQWSRGNQNLPNTVKTVFQRMALLFKRIAAAAREIMGKKTTAEDVFSRVESGRIGKRGVDSSNLGSQVRQH